MHLPKYSKYIIIGAGIHGLSTAYHLARELKAKGRGSGKDILVTTRLPSLLGLQALHVVLFVIIITNAQCVS